MVYTGNLERFEKRSFQGYEGRLYQDEMHLRAKLTKAGLTPKRVEVVIDRLVKGKTFLDIAKDRGFKEAGAAGHAFNAAIEALKSSPVFTRGKHGKKA